MLYFFADNHYGAHCGAVLAKELETEFPLTFYEDDWRDLATGEWRRDCQVLMLNLIGGTCDVPPPSQQAAEEVRGYLEQGGNMLLLHGASAAFWQWEWWRRLPGFRWVRPGDPDGVEASIHPTLPYTLERAKCRHPLVRRLPERVDIPEDELYIQLEQTGPAMVLMEVQALGRSWPQCAIMQSPWGGKIVEFIPGHRPEAVKACVPIITEILHFLQDNPQ